MRRPCSLCRAPTRSRSSSRPTSGTRHRGRRSSCSCVQCLRLDAQAEEEESRLVPVRFPRRNAMHTVIRRYEGVGDTAEVARRAVEEFGPMLSDRPGFQGYWAIDAGDGVAATITVFDTEEQATESIA